MGGGGRCCQPAVVGILPPASPQHPCRGAPAKPSAREDRTSAPLPARPPPPSSVLHPSHLGDGRLPSSGVQWPRGTGGAAAPGGCAWCRRVSRDPRQGLFLSAPSWVPGVPAHTSGMPVPGTRHTRKGGVGGARPPCPPPPRRSHCSRGRPRSVPGPAINYAARRRLQARPDVRRPLQALVSPRSVIGAPTGLGGSSLKTRGYVMSNPSPEGEVETIYVILYFILYHILFICFGSI